MTTPPTGGSERARVYVVDDDLSVLRSLRRLFTAMGFAVEGFASAEDFLAQPRCTERACLVLDVKLPGMDGLALQQWLARNGSRLPVIILTAHDDSALRARALAAGAVSFISKPFDAGRLERAVHAALE